MKKMNAKKIQEINYQKDEQIRIMKDTYEK